MSIKDELIAFYPEAEFGSHETDLYVKYTRCIWKHLENDYEWFINCSTFISEIDGERWIDIPFANED